MSLDRLVAELVVVGRKAVAAGLVIGSRRQPVGAPAGRRRVRRHLLRQLAGRADAGRLLGRRARTARCAAGTRGPSSEVPLHLATYRVRPDVNAVVHLHPQTSVLLDALGLPIRLLTIDQAYYVREVRSTPFIQSGTQELADAGAAAVADGCNCVVLGHHGCSALGDTVETAHKRAANLEEAARATLTMLQLGDTSTVCPPQYLETIRAREAAARPGH